MKFSMHQLKKRILQSTYSLMKETGDVYNCGTTKNGEVCRYSWKKNGAKILGVAHCDTVNRGSDHFYNHKNFVWSSRLDDRLGVYILLDILPKLGIEIDILLTDFEERGMSTGQFFNPKDTEYNWMFQFDRSGTDAVYYQYDKMKFFLEQKKLFETEKGSFSDIVFMDHLGICGCNIGTAYYNEHTLGSYADLSELKEQINKFMIFYEKFHNTKIPFKQEKQYFSKNEEKTWFYDDEKISKIKHSGMSIYTNLTNFYH